MASTKEPSFVEATSREDAPREGPGWSWLRVFETHPATGERDASQSQGDARRAVSLAQASGRHQPDQYPSSNSPIGTRLSGDEPVSLQDNKMRRVLAVSAVSLRPSSTPKAWLQATVGVASHVPTSRGARQSRPLPPARSKAPGFSVLRGKEDPQRWGGVAARGPLWRCAGLDATVVEGLMARRALHIPTGAPQRAPRGPGEGQTVAARGAARSTATTNAPRHAAALSSSAASGELGATLEATQGQILSQSPTDATRFWWHLYGS